MKNILKITIVLIMLFMIIGQFNYVYAGEKVASTKSTFSQKDIDDWNPGGGPSNKEEQEELKQDIKQISGIAGIVMGAIRVAGVVISVIILMVFGIKEMTASIEEKSNLRKAFPSYILGAIMVFAMTTIPTIIYQAVTGIKV